MIDTLSYIVSDQWRGGGSPLDVGRYIDVVKSGQYERTGEPYIMGKLGCLNVTATDKRVKIYGSISKMIQGENVSSPSREAVSEELKKISDMLHLDCGSAAVSRVDVANTFKMSADPVAYIAQIRGEGKTEDTGTLYLRDYGRCLCFYDKRAEVVKTGCSVPHAWADCPNLLRYELRLYDDIGRRLGLGRQAVRVSELVSPEVWDRLIDEWAKVYMRVSATRLTRLQEAKSKAQVIDWLLSDLLSQAPPDYLNILEYTKKRRGGTMLKSERYRLNKYLKSLVNVEEGGLTGELDKAVIMAQKRAKQHNLIRK